MNSRALAIAVFAIAPHAHAGVTAVPTFESIGLYWSDSGGGPTVPANVRYRVHGSNTWYGGMPLWFDARAVATDTPVARPANEYRGSLLGLAPGTTYDVELALGNTCAAQSLSVTTWSDVFPAGMVYRVPAMSGTELRITAGGAPGGYAVYTGASPGATIDVAGNADQTVYVDAPYVIIRGLTLRGGRLFGINLGPSAHDIVIEGNDISQWGTLSSDPSMRSMGICDHGSSGENGAVNCYETEPPPGAQAYPHNHDRIVVQRNRIHDPNCSAGSWWLTTDNSHHPAGTEGVRLSSCGGNHVVRYNDIVTDADHCWNDGIGGGENFSFMGAYPYDTDIYGNHITYACDDAIEVDGGSRNTRVWGNR